MKASFLKEIERFDRCGRQPASGPRTDLGIQQFHHFESTGQVPDNPDPYYLLLLDGKKWWEWTLNQYAELYVSHDWWGWLQVATDWQDDPVGFKQIRQRCRCSPVSPAEILEMFEWSNPPEQSES